MAQYAPPPMGRRRSQSMVDLILRGGDIQADKAYRAGNTWGGTINQMGQIIGSGMQEADDRQERADDKAATTKRGEALTAFVADPPKDPDEYLAGAIKILGPVEGPAFARESMAYRRTVELARAGEAPTLEEFKYTLSGIARLWKDDPEAVKRGWGDDIGPAMIPGAKKHWGKDLTTTWQDDYGQTLDMYLREKQAAPPTPGSREELAGLDPESPEYAKSIADTRALAEAGRAAPPPRVPTPVIEEEAAARARGTESVMGPRREASAASAARKGETSLRKEYTKQTKSAVDGIQAIDRFSLKPFEKMQRGEELTPEDQFAMIYAFNKALDPTSVVREGEFRNTRQVGLGIHERAFLLLEKWRTGAQLGQAQTKGMMEVIQGTKQTLRAQIMDQDTYFTGLALDYGFDADNVVGGSRGYTDGGTGADSGSFPSETQQELNRLFPPE